MSGREDFCIYCILMSVLSSEMGSVVGWICMQFAWHGYGNNYCFQGFLENMASFCKEGICPTKVGTKECGENLIVFVTEAIRARGFM